MSLPSEEVEETDNRLSLDQARSWRVREGAGEPPKKGCARMYVPIKDPSFFFFFSFLLLFFFFCFVFYIGYHI